MIVGHVDHVSDRPQIQPNEQTCVSRTLGLPRSKTMTNGVFGPLLQL
jgi:hypothetical protein